VSVPAEVSLAAIRAELTILADYVSAASLAIDASELSESRLCFHVRFSNRDDEQFNVEFQCSEYPLYPPTVEFVSADRAERGTKRLYPQGFHPTPCVCMRYNRKAYSERGGPHGDWRLLDWRLPTGGGIAIDSLTMMVSDLHSKIRQSSGRMP
jgi:hypothetical protein